MKIVRILLIIAGLLVAALLIIPLFAPAKAEVQAEIVIRQEPAEIFPLVASFRDRAAWDPWATADTTAMVSITPKEGYVGSTYAWEGEQIGTGRMEVIAVDEPRSITSHLWFGAVETPSLVEWTFEPVEGGTRVTWKFSQETGYPVERLAMMFGKIFLKQSFNHGLENLKILLESMPSPEMMVNNMKVESLPQMTAMMASGGGTPQTISRELGKLYGMIMQEINLQKLQMTGAPFTHYLDYDEATGFTHFLAGIPVARAGKASGIVYPKKYGNERALVTLHFGSYESMARTYRILEEYMDAQEMESKGEVMEFYLTDPDEEPDTARWRTRIAYILN